VTGPLSVSTPVPPTDGPGASLRDTTAPPAREGQPGPTQRHPFVPATLTLAPRGTAPATTAVETIDTSSTGELTLPKDAGHVGWWQSGALAGDAYGSVVLAGHIDSRDTGVGFFARLLKVRPGDEVVLDGSGYQQRYRVVATRDVPKASLATSTDTFSQGVPGRLVLLTCTGPFDPVTHYPDNLVVTAEPVGVPTAVP
jgi:LPXTG-site transpeptidase (sortase) family protein